ncbi:QRFP-like peptide receptor isoform X1 [Ptychodera flava]|uniref:QRFP-like peptide receptor isoform X1 n=1 Tax=Ptychodera flava TaxID=63121 RepID=UPI00396A1BFD
MSTSDITGIEFLRLFLLLGYNCSCFEESCKQSSVYWQFQNQLCGNMTNLPPMDELPSQSVEFDDPISTTGQSVLIAAYSIAIALSLVGNLTVIVVLSRSKRSRSNLNIYLINLAVADIAMAIFCMPFTFMSVMLQEWTFGDFMCPFVYFMQQVSVLASIFTLLVISVGRCRAVESPLSVRTRSPSYRKILMIAVIWILAINISIVELFITRTHTAVENNVTRVICQETWPGNAAAPMVYELCYTSISFVIPLIIMCAMYGRIAQQLWNRNVPDNDNKSRHEQQLKMKWKVIRMVVLVVFVFFFCWLPLHVLRIIYHVNEQLIVVHSKTVVKVYFAVHYLAMSDSFLNPFIYTFLNENFRTDLKHALPCNFKTIAGRHHQSSISRTEYTRTSFIKTISLL